ncbi:MAG: sel1 repeat family protein [Treponema sp.]|nr:sel1 repeat family protein [Treponema sp.]
MLYEESVNLMSKDEYLKSEGVEKLGTYNNLSVYKYSEDSCEGTRTMYYYDKGEKLEMVPGGEFFKIMKTLEPHMYNWQFPEGEKHNQEIYDLKMKAFGGDPEAQEQLGLMLNNGIGGVPQDQVIGPMWIEKAAQQGLDSSQYYMGFLNYYAYQDFEKAAYWFKLSLEQGYALAAFELGKMHIEGKGVERNTLYGIHLVQAAARAGIEEAVDFFKEFTRFDDIDALP